MIIAAAIELAANLTVNAVIEKINKRTNVWIWACEIRIASFFELYIVSQVALFDDFATNKSIDLKYDVIRVCVTIAINEINETRGLKILEISKINKLLLPKINWNNLSI